MKTIYSIFLVLFIFLLSCEKEEEPRQFVSVTLNEDAKAFLKVTPGKYLVYKDSATLEIDSIIITKCNLSYSYYNEYISNDLFVPNTPAYSGENFQLEYTKKTDTNISSIWFKGIAKAQYQHFVPLTNLPLHLVHNIDQMAFTTDSFYYDENTIPLSNYTIDGISYSDVIIYKTNSGLDINHPLYLKATYYWAKGIGIIQRSIERTGGVNQTFYLIRHD